MNFFDNIKYFSPKIISLFPNDMALQQKLPPDQFFEINVIKHEDNNMDSYMLKIKSNINDINDNTVDYFIFFKLIYNEAVSKNNTFSIANYYKYLQKLLNYIYINIYTK